MPTQILFVCYANLIRSPLAENLFLHLAHQAGVADRFIVDSAGTGASDRGDPPHPKMRRVAEKHGLALQGRSRRFQVQDFDDFDWVVVMDEENRVDVLHLARTAEARAKVRLLRDFDPQGGRDASVPDPYFASGGGYERTYEIIERSVRGLLQSLLEDDL